MTPIEIKRHAAKILWLRKSRRHGVWCGRFQKGIEQAADEFVDPYVVPARRRAGDPAAVDTVFEARRTRGVLPKGCWS